jgi:hypothetical protein
MHLYYQRLKFIILYCFDMLQIMSVVVNNCVFCGKKHFNSHLLVTVCVIQAMNILLQSRTSWC